MGVLKWYLVYRVATRGRRRRKAAARARAALPTIFEVAEPGDDEVFEVCDECGEILGEHLMGDDEVFCP